MKSDKTIPRRNFLKYTGSSLVAASLSGIASTSDIYAFSMDSGQDFAPGMTVEELIDLIIQQIPGGKKEETVDTVKIGDVSQELKGVVTTFMATVEVIEQTAWLGANLIITHEPTFYNHRDEIQWLAEDKVYQHKKALLEKHGIVVWRFHDYWHTHRPDGILQGFLEELSWENFLDPGRENICVIPKISLQNLARYFKKQMQLKRTFFVGDPELECRNVGILPGAWGGSYHIPFLGTEDIDVLVVGESAEWEAVEYVRDASHAGLKKGLIILGHARSEEPGMRWLVKWLQPRIPAIKVTHLAAGDPLIPVRE